MSEEKRDSVPFPLLLGIAILILGFLLVAIVLWMPGGKSVKPSVSKESGPVEVVESTFDYHQTLKRPNGERFEFYHCSWDGTISEKGRVVNIRYSGDGRTMGDCATIESVSLIKESPNKSKANRAETLTTEASKVLGNQGYRELLLGFDPNANRAVAKEHGYDNCDLWWQGKHKKHGLTDGVICQKPGSEALNIVVTDRP